MAAPRNREDGMNISARAIQALIEDRCGGDVDWCGAYGEPGYSDPERGIIFANWNKVSKPVYSWLESHGYGLEWSDEWIVSHETGKAYRTSPDGYGWLPSYLLTEGGDVIGADEIRNGDEIDTYIEHLMNDANRADTFGIDWTEHGFRKLNADAYESGFHPGQTDNPRKILAAAQAAYPNDDFIFSIDGAGQFDMRFSLWARSPE
jgi:hypothetical protein